VVAVGVAGAAPEQTGNQDHEVGPPSGGSASIYVCDKGELTVECNAERP
jgi:hypothetical protein